MSHTNLAPHDRPLRADARRNRERILAAAETVLGEQGLAAPIDDIARSAGVGVGTVYRHFPTKDALLEAIVVAHFLPLIEEAQRLADAEDAGAALFGFLDDMVAAAGHKALANAIAESDPQIRRRRESWSVALRESMAQLLERAQRAGAVRADVTSDEIRLLLAGMCIACDRLAPTPQLREQAMATVRAGLCPR